MWSEAEGLPQQERTKNMTDGATPPFHCDGARRGVRRSVLAALLVLLLLLTMSTWLGCDFPPPRPGPPPPPADAAQCSNGIAVPSPQENDGLVKDCETLLNIRDTITKPGRLYWSSQDSILDWKGVIVDTDRSEPRVTGLELVYLYLDGTLPSELDRLTELETLIVRDNNLSGKSLLPWAGSPSW